MQNLWVLSLITASAFFSIFFWLKITFEQVEEILVYAVECALPNTNIIKPCYKTFFESTMTLIATFSCNMMCGVWNLWDFWQIKDKTHNGKTTSDTLVMSSPTLSGAIHTNVKLKNGLRNTSNFKWACSKMVQDFQELNTTLIDHDIVSIAKFRSGL